MVTRKESSGMKLEILLSTMQQVDYNVLEELNVTTNITVINQSNDDCSTQFGFKGNDVRWINTKARGLSKSRNEAIVNSRNDICLLSDDDMYYYDNISEEILKVVGENPEVSIFIFNVANVKSKFNSFKPLDKLDVLRVSSVQIVFRRRDILKNNIRFDERFGSGSGKYLSGEENIFLMECFKHKLKIMSVPIEIGCLNQGASSWFVGFNSKYFFDKGALFRVLFGNWGLFIGFAFVIKKYKLIGKDCSFFSALKSSYCGYKSLTSIHVEGMTW